MYEAEENENNVNWMHLVQTFVSKFFFFLISAKNRSWDWIFGGWKENKAWILKEGSNKCIF